MNTLNYYHGMKSKILLAIVLCICGKSIGQDTLRIFGKTNFNIEYFYDLNKNNKIVFTNTTGVYEIRIPIKSKFRKITIYESGNNYCTQELNIKSLVDYTRTLKTTEIRNDLTHLNNCIATDTATVAKEYENFIGFWKGTEFEMGVQPDVAFYLLGKDYLKSGHLKLINSSTILLEVEYVQPIQLGTYEDKSEKICFKLENDNLISEDKKITLKRSN